MNMKYKNEYPNSHKEIVSPESVVENLLALRNELFEDSEDPFDDVTKRELFFKINSCLYDKYPINE